MPRPTIPNRRAALLDAAEQEVLQHGFDAVRIVDVAGAAGVAKGAVYLEFPSKGAILEALLIRAMHRVASHSRRVLDDAPDAELSLGVVYRASVEALLADRLATAALLDDRDILGRQVDTLGRKRYAGRVDSVKVMLRALAEHGAIHGDCDLDGLAVALSSATLGLLSASAKFGPLTEQELSAALDSLAQLVERGTSSGEAIRDPKCLRAKLTEVSDQFLAQTSA